MLTGVTSTGFEYTIADDNLDDMELLDALAAVDNGNILAASKVCTLLFGKEQKKALIDTVTQKLGERLGIAPTDVFIVINDPPNENWGLGGKQRE